MQTIGREVVTMYDISLINQMVNSSLSGVCTGVVVVMTIVTSIPSGVIYR